MIHSRKDYNRIQDPLNLIPNDEPVFLLRGKDANIIRTLIHYRDLCNQSGNDFSTKEMIESLEVHITRIRNYQKTFQDNGGEIRTADLKNPVEVEGICKLYEISLLRDGNKILYDEILELKNDNEVLKTELEVKQIEVDALISKVNVSPMRDDEDKTS